MDRFICAFVLSLVSVTALGAETINLGPSDWRKWDPRTSNHTLEGLRTSYGQPVRMGSGGSINLTRNPVVPYGGIVNGMKSFVRVTPGSLAASAAVTGLFLAVDWVFDQASGEWVKMEGVEELSVDIWQGTRNSYFAYGPTPEAACIAFGNLGGWSNLRGKYDYHIVTGTTGRCWFSDSNKSIVELKKIKDCAAGATYNIESGKCIGGLEPVSLTSSDWDDLESLLPSSSPVSVGTAAGDSMKRQGAPLPGFSDTDISGPSSVTGPTTSTSSTGPDGTITSSSTTTTNISYGPTSITTTNTTTTNTYTNGEPSGTTTTTETPSPDLVTEPAPSPGSTSLDIPTDCEFMPTVCAFLDWFKEPIPMPEPDLPVVVDHDFEREYEMNLTAECPPPYTVDTQLFGTLSISWAPFCDLAGLMKPLVVGSAFLMSAFITLGIGRGRA